MDYPFGCPVLLDFAHKDTWFVHVEARCVRKSRLLTAYKTSLWNIVFLWREPK